MIPVYALASVPAALALAILVARATRAALDHWHMARADSAFAEPHRCPVCVDLRDDEANGILRTDFDLWESEWTP